MLVLRPESIEFALQLTDLLLPLGTLTLELLHLGPRLLECHGRFASEPLQFLPKLLFNLLLVLFFVLWAVAVAVHVVHIAIGQRLFGVVHFMGSHLGQWGVVSWDGSLSGDVLISRIFPLIGTNTHLIFWSFSNADMGY